MISEGFRLMAVGMFTVFAFLTLLVGMMAVSAAFFERFSDRFPEDTEGESGGGATRTAGNDEEIALALALAEASREGHSV